MSHWLKVGLLALALLLAVVGAFAQSTPQATSGPKPAWPSYVFSILLGFGTGQYWAGQNGNLFLVGDLSCIGVIAVGAAVAIGSPTSSGSGFSGATAGYLMISTAAIAYSVFRIWELMDVFGAVDRARRAGTVAFIEPVISVEPASLALGVTLHL